MNFTLGLLVLGAMGVLFAYAWVWLVERFTAWRLRCARRYEYGPIANTRNFADGKAIADAVIEHNGPPLDDEEEEVWLAFLVGWHGPDAEVDR